MANQAWQISEPGAYKLVTLDTAIPKPGSKQALVRIYAASYNYRDKLIRDLSPDYPLHAQPNLVPASDGAGIVQEAGTDSIWKKGDRVIIHAHDWLTGDDPRQFDMHSVIGSGTMDGTLRRYLVWDDAKLIRAPSQLSMEEAASLWCAGLTAFRGLFHGPIAIGPGTTVLTQGTGGVSCFAIQFAAAAGAPVIATSSSDDKLAVARKLGATHTINYRKIPDWSSEVLKVTDGKGVDLTIDVVGAESIERTLASTRFGGGVVLVGLLSEDPNLKVAILQSILYGGKTCKCPSILIMYCSYIY